MAAPNKEDILRTLAFQSMEAFQKRFERKEGEALPLQSFEIVGGINVDLQTGRSRDAQRFYDMFFYLLKTGVPIRPDFTLHVSNLLQDEDYLQTKSKADVTLISFVPMMQDEHDETLVYVNIKSPSVEFLRAAIEFAEEQNPDYRGQRNHGNTANQMVSYLQTVEKWRERLKESGSKFIFSIFCGREVHLGEVMPQGYSSLGLYDQHDRFRDHTRVSDVERPSGNNWQVIGDNEYIKKVAVVARQHMSSSTHEAYKDAKNTGTQMGTCIHEVCFELFEREMKEEDAKEYPQRSDATVTPKPADISKNGSKL